MTTRSIAVVDCETDPFKIGRVPKPFVWGFYDGVTYRQFPAKPMRSVPTKNFVRFMGAEPRIVYAHNGGKFDWHFLLDYLNPYDDIMIINGRLAKCMIGGAECRDSYNILPVPLAAYKKDQIDYAIMEASERYKRKNWEEISKYLRSDCVYLYELISQFVAKYGVQITQASASMSQWKKISKRQTPQTTREFYDIFAPYYYGGRVQCFQAGIIEKRFAVFDINSAYPFAMLQQHPYSEEYTHVEKYLHGADFYRVRCRSMGAFPFRGMGDSSGVAGLWFPSDGQVREFTVTGWEYQAAKDTGHLKGAKVLESFVFTEHTDFRAYIEHFYEMRLKAKAEGNDAESLFAKLLMNSLYGKFAANPDNYRHYIVVPMDVIAGLPDAGFDFAGEIGPWGLAECPLLETEQRYYNVATGASITGFVRAMLWRAICSCKGVLYCDTDSVAVERRGKALTLGGALGQWKHEGDFDRAGIAGKKLYIFRGVLRRGKRDYKTASKGARLTHRQLWDVAQGKGVVFQSDVPTFSPTKRPEFVTRNIRYTAK